MIKGLGIRQKLMMMVIATVTVALLFTTASLSYYQKLRLDEEVINRLNALAQVLADRSVVAVMFMDKKNAKQNLQALISVNDIEYGCLYHYDVKKTIAEVSFTDNNFHCEQAKDSHKLGLNDEYVFSVVELDNNTNSIGYLFIAANLNELKEQQLEMRQVVFVASLISALLALLLTRPLRKNIYAPIMQLSNIAHSITEDRDWSLRAERLSRDELGELVDAFNNMLGILQKDQQELEDLAYMDALTGLPNRRLFREKLARAISHSMKTNKPYGLIFIDLDNFKWVNDNLGHDMGDKLLITLGQRFRTQVREQDELCRIGGDEFTIVMDGIDGPDDLIVMAKSLLDSLKTPIDLAGTTYIASTSIGLAVGNGVKDDVKTILKKSDLAVYQAKSAGKNTYSLFEGEL